MYLLVKAIVLPFFLSSQKVILIGNPVHGPEECGGSFGFIHHHLQLNSLASAGTGGLSIRTPCSHFRAFYHNLLRLTETVVPKGGLRGPL